MAKKSSGGGRSEGSGRGNIWVTPGLDVKREGQSKPISSHNKQSRAIESGRREAKREGVELVVQRAQGPRKGEIRSKDSFGPDPLPPRDREH